MTVAFNHGAFMRALRKQRGKVPQDLYDDIMAALDVGLGNAADPLGIVPVKGDGPAWLAEARSHMGTKEIPGARHNGKILGWVKALGGWFTDDETPWCGTFVGYCVHIAGLPVPKHWYRAKAWAEWGKPTPPRVGAIIVFDRQGGGHVGFVVGESATDYYVLGGNQSNAVNIMPLSKGRKPVMRWPVSLPLSDERLPKMSGGTRSVNEA